MKTVTIGISSKTDVKARMRRAFQHKEQGAFISVASDGLLWNVITPKRWEMLRTMTGTGRLAIREVARRIGHDVKPIHGDIQALLKAGVPDKDDDGRIVFPYDAVHVDFVLHAI